MTTWVCFGLGSFADFTRSSWPLMPRWTTRVSPLSSVSSRYLPSRPTDLIVRPSSRARKCFAEACRRTERPLATETVLILRPTTSRARSWRSVSTSGSSGTGQFLPGRQGRRLLGVLLGAPLTRPADGPAQEHLRHVGPVVVRPGPHHDVAGCPLPVPHRLLLKPALVVEVVGLLARPLDRLPQLTEHQLTGGLPAGVEVHGPEDGLERVGQDGRLGAAARALLAPSEEEDVPDAQSPGHLGQDTGVDHGGADLGQLALGEVGEALVGVAGHDQTQHGVAQELEALVGRRAALLLPAPAPVREGVLKEAQVAEGMAKSLGQCGRPLSTGVNPPRAWRRRSQQCPGPCAGPRDPRRRCGTRRSAPPAPPPGLRPARSGPGSRHRGPPRRKPPR